MLHTAIISKHKVNGNDAQRAMSFLICLISGIVLSFAFPRANLYWLAWFSLAPMMYHLFRGTWKSALAGGFAFGLGFFGAHLSWIGVFGKLPWIALSIFQALYIAGFALTARLIAYKLGPWQRLAALPTLWVAFEWVRSLTAFGFTWGDLGYSQHAVLPVAQIASVTGVWGVSFLVASSNAVLAGLASAPTISARRAVVYHQLPILALAILVAIVFGHLEMRKPPVREGRSLRVAVVQGNVNPDLWYDYRSREAIWEGYRRLTLSAAKEHPDLVVWPESAVPGNLGTDPFLQKRLISLADTIEARMLVGGSDEDAAGHGTNTAFLVIPGKGITGKYAKVHLVPFGEYVPARRYLPFLRYYQVTPMDVFPGEGHFALDAGCCRLGTVICFESIFPYISRTMAADGAGLLCVITNDSWFERTAAAEQHMSISVFRAIENHRYLVRAAATGISCIIDPHGRVLRRTSIFESDVIQSEVCLLSGRTLYARYGEWFVYFCLLVAAALILHAIANRLAKVKT